MAAWLLPALRFVLPHVGTIIKAAAPVFTRKDADAASNPAPLLRQQIAELQAAASQNAAHIRELAAQLEKTVAALEHDGALAEAKVRRAVLLCAAALAISVVSLSVAVMLLFAR